MIVHGFTFLNEIELLSLKLEELWDVVDVFVLVESTHTFSGNEKPFYYDLNKHLFQRYEHKIHNLRITPPETNDVWVREKFQRDIILDFVRSPIIKAKPSDVLLISDMDEIVSKESVMRWLLGETDHLPTTLMMKMYYYYINNLADMPWGGGQIFKVGAKLDQTLSELRYNPNLPIIENGGWHFSFLAGKERRKERIRHKIRSYAHNDLYGFVADDQILDRHLEQGTDWFNTRNLAFRFVEVDDTYPKFITQNLSTWKEFIK